MRQIQEVRTPSGPLALIRPVAERLLAEGVISGALDGDLHAADAATVKAAILSHSVCDFCSVPGASHFYDVPDFGVTSAAPDSYSATRSTGGWMACDTCAGLVQADKRKALVDRAMETMAFPKFSRAMVEQLYAKFWQGLEVRSRALGAAAALRDYVNDVLPETAPAEVTERGQREAMVRKVFGLGDRELQAVLDSQVPDRDLAAKLDDRIGKLCGPGVSITPRGVVELLAGGASSVRPLPYQVPHWQRALDARFEAIGNLRTVLNGGGIEGDVYFTPEATDLNDPAALARLARRSDVAREAMHLGFDEDIKALRAAQTYSFNGETIAAIREAARSLPHEAALSSIETPNTGAGWFWFADPLDLASSPQASDKTDAMLWCWHDDRNGPALRFSAYVINREFGGELAGKVLPSTRWFWPLEMSFADMMEHNRASHRRSYGDGGTALRPGMKLAGEVETLRVVHELSLFFVMACLWFRQTVPTTGRKISPTLTQQPGHVERHARKRLMREHQLPEPPTVQVVALRKSVRVPSEDAPAERRDGAREYKCRWIVQGHPRHQACGPGRKDRKLIWITAHEAGPEGAPLRTREKVYAVVR